MKVINCFFAGLLLLASLFTLNCNNNKDEKKVSEIPAPADSSQKKEPVKEVAARGPVINIGDTLSIKRTVLTMKDSAATMDRVAVKLAEIYGSKLGTAIKKNNLTITGAPMAWYKSQQAPYFFEAGIPVDKRPAKLPAGMFIKEIGIDSVVVAHFYGPYELLPQAYEALSDWLTDHKKKIKGTPYEIYIGDPLDSTGKAKDPYKVQTDVVFAWR